MPKKEPIIHHGLLYDWVNMKALIEAQASQPVFDANSKEQKSKVKTLERTNSIYKRTIHK